MKRKILIPLLLIFCLIIPFGLTSCGGGGGGDNDNNSNNSSLKNYTIIFQDEDGTELSKMTYHYGDTVTEPAEPTRESDEIYEYTFAGWDSEVVPVTEDKVYRATYTKTEIENPLATATYVLKGDGTIDFGSYPQTKVTDNSLISSLTSKAGTLPTESNSGTWISYKYYIGTNSNNSGTNTTDFMWYKDISYGGEKYRAIYFTSYRPCVTHFPSSTISSNQDDNGYYINTLYFFKFEPINWRILTQSDDKALLMCNMIIDSQEYYNSSKSRTINGKKVNANNYAESNIRKWLNDNFYNTAFSELQKQLIEKTTVDNSVRSTNPNNNATEFNSGNNSNACENTNDYIFLLSEQEVTNSAYGFDENYDNNDKARQLKGTDYAKSQGLCVYTNSGSYTGCSKCWLRSPRDSLSNCAWCVSYDGGADSDDGVYSTYWGVVPALWISLDKNVEEIPEEPKDPNEPEEPEELEEQIESTDTYTLKSDGTIDFGSYPQTKVTDESLITSLTGLAGTLPTESNSGTWTSYKYYISSSNTTDFMWYKDISYGVGKYRAIYFTSYRPSWTSDSSSTDYSYQDDNGYNTNTIYFFKFEPINWRILTQENGKALLMCNMIINSQEYYDNRNDRTINDKTVYANNYAESNIRKWLNDNFYNTAFTELEKQIIELTTIDNSTRSTNPNNNATEFNSGNNSYACENTNDYIFLLSEQEVTNSAYGFDENYDNNDTARQLKGTDYAKSQGLWVYTSSGYSCIGCSYWWLRSPSYDDYDYASYVYYYGCAYDSYDVFKTYGVVPALWIKL